MGGTITESNKVAATDDQVSTTVEQEEGVLSGRLEQVSIFPEGRYQEWYEQIPRPANRVRKFLDAGAQHYSYAGYLPCNLFIFDDVVLIENSQVDGIEPGTYIESRNDVVRMWAFELFERYREESTPITVEDLPN